MTVLPRLAIVLSLTAAPVLGQSFANPNTDTPEELADVVAAQSSEISRLTAELRALEAELEAMRTALDGGQTSQPPQGLTEDEIRSMIIGTVQAEISNVPTADLSQDAIRATVVAVLDDGVPMVRTRDIELMNREGQRVGSWHAAAGTPRLWMSGTGSADSLGFALDFGTGAPRLTFTGPDGAPGLDLFMAADGTVEVFQRQ